MTLEEAQDQTDDGPVFTHEAECAMRALQQGTQGAVALSNLLLSLQQAPGEAQATYRDLARRKFEEALRWIEKANNPPTSE